MAAPSQGPNRYPNGFTSDPVYGPLGQMGMQNPFFYHLWSDDFDQEIAESGYTKTTTGNGTVALAAGDGGLALFTTNTSTPATTDIASIQLPVAGFTFTAGKKSFFLTRVQSSDMTNAAILAGLIQTTTTPFTVTDGIYFYKASGAASLVLITTVGSVPTSLTIPTSAYSLANNVNVDLGFYVDRKQNIYAFVGAQLVGYLPQQGTGSTVPSGAVAAIQQTITPTTLTTANLNPTLAIQSGTASSKTMAADFLLAAKER